VAERHAPTDSFVVSAVWEEGVQAGVVGEPGDDCGIAPARPSLGYADGTEPAVASLGHVVSVEVWVGAQEITTVAARGREVVRLIELHQPMLGARGCSQGLVPEMLLAGVPPGVEGGVDAILGLEILG